MFLEYIDHKCTDEELKEIVCKHGLLQYNIDATEGLLLKPGVNVNLVCRDKDGNVIGGIMCETYLECLDINVLWVAEAYRGKGIGYRLMNEAERLGKEAGCIYSITSTFSFQAPNFYKRQGYELYSVLDCFPNNICSYQYKKKL
ncbi:GNAT family N-acetyltransferase [Sedimentibacter sp. zth1]|uniref:GNAT family N-acetyltransferase n=1 Tax=Sedimentibacter sp. zth1 TaxID=2816908 RepID=UPI001A9206E9|nr:GNAT family N-acetyltransferase [Sedimentibacter sp. zth1]QSX06616.1 GNAT family N-acetyltransferase [Sedimentibacter sp. zth1]